MHSHKPLPNWFHSFLLVFIAFPIFSLLLQYRVPFPLRDDHIVHCAF